MSGEDCHWYVITDPTGIVVSPKVVVEPKQIVVEVAVVAPGVGVPLQAFETAWDRKPV